VAINLIDDLLKMHAVSADAAKAYEKAAEQLIEHVNSELSANRNVLGLIGGNSLNLMHSNHNHHFAFMAMVFNLGAFGLLAKTVPWVYRVYRARGFLHEYFLIELAAWKHAMEKCLDGASFVEIVPIYDWLIFHHEDMVRLSENDEGLQFSSREEMAPRQEAFLSMLLRGDCKGSLQLANRSVQTIDDIKHFYLEVVSPVMRRIGLLWESNHISVAEEHLATAIVSRIAAAFYPRFANLDVRRGCAVVTAAPNDLHEVGARMLADFLEMEGWDVIYLGANTPKEALLAVLRQRRPFMVALSVTTVFNLDCARRAIAMIKAERENQNMKIMVGGIAFDDIPSLWSDLGADGFEVNANKGALSANAWWEERIIE
jgi:methanogenic corrinoid protein MtbC1